MEKVVSTVLVLVLSLAIGMAAGAYTNKENVIVMPQSSDLEAVDQWFESLDQAKQTRTKLHFYVQDFTGGENRTNWEVAKAEITPISPTNFGLVIVFDDLVTAGTEPDSEVVGRLQGVATSADLRDTANLMSMTIFFTEGKYKGSTLVILARNPRNDNYRELPIVGGTGIFRRASGIAVIHLYSNPTPDYAVIEYFLYITH